MATLSLKISTDNGAVVKTMQFDPSTTVYDACRIIREKILEASHGDPKEYGLFLTSDEDSKKGIWLEPSRSLDYYILRNGDVLDYNRKMRNLRVRMLDGTVKTLLVDDSQVVANLMVVICTKIGITNYDEYGLVREDQKDEPDPSERPNYGTLTLRKKHQEKERDAKMEQLRKKLRTDDEVNWVEPSKTLREQGIDVTETLLLRRKLFFSDRNVDSRDPVQLNLLYVQARDAILDGTHPITQDKACEFAGIQCQIQFGDHKEDKHTPGFLDLKEFLPASYMKVKGIEKKVFKEHRKHIGLSELDAKVLYTKSARSLKTYGVTFFLVKEKMKGKNKLVPRLLGVTKDSVLRLDERTKEILQSWPLTTVRRWCGSPNTFTLDFGDYSDQYYSVQTTEAEQILQVISGYIDIIMKKRRAADHLGIQGDEGSAMMEDSVSPSRANIIQHESFKPDKVKTESVAKPAVLRPGAEGPQTYSMTHTISAQQTTISGQIVTGHTPPNVSVVQQTKISSVMSEPQRALLSTISTGREVIKHTERELTRASIPDIGTDSASMKWKKVTMETNKQAVTSHIAAMNAATAQVVTLTSGPTEEVDHTAVGAAITTITSNLPEMTKGVQMLAALMDDSDNGDRLLDATRKLCTAFSDLLKAAEPETKEPRQSLLNAASRVGEASTSVLHTITEETEEERETQDILLSQAKSVANTTAALVLKAKNVAAQCKDDQQLQNSIISAATHCALATSQLVACAKVVAPTINNPLCREQLISAARQVGSAVERLLSVCNTVPEGNSSVEELTSAARKVTEALERLLSQCEYDRESAVAQESRVESVMTATERLVAAGDAAEMVRQARVLGQATAHLITDIKTEAEHQPSEAQRKLLAAAKLLADATAKMVEAARQCASSPQDREKQDALRRAAEELRYITVDYAEGQDIVGSQLQRLQEAARHAASSGTQLVMSAQNAAQYNTNRYSQETLSEECKLLSEHIPRVLESIRPQSGAAAHLELISASDNFLQCSSHVIQSSRGALPTVSDASAAKQLSDTVQQFTSSCAELRTAVGRARISCKGLELDAATEIIASLHEQLDEVEEAARTYHLRPLPGQTSEWAVSHLSSCSRAVMSASARLVGAARGGDAGGAGRAGGELAGGVRDYVHGLTAATAAMGDDNTRARIISCGRNTLDSSLTLVETVKRYLHSGTVDGHHLNDLAKDLSQSLERTIESVPTHAELDRAVQNIDETLHILDMGEFPPTNRTYGDLQYQLNSLAVDLNSASSDVVQSVDSMTELTAAGQHYGDKFNDLMGVAMEMAGQTEDIETRTVMVNSMKSVTINSTKLLATAKSVNQDLSRPNAKNQLAAAARAVTDSINRLVDACTSALPGQKECSAAVMRIQSTKPLLNSPSQPINELGYYATLDQVLEHSKKLSEGMSGMASSAKRSEHEQFAHSVHNVADAICGLVECTAQSAYLAAVADESSVAGRAGLVDQAHFSRAHLAVRDACEQLADPTADQQQVLSAATVIAKHTSALCNACRVASSKTNEPAAKRHFVQAAKDVANCTAALVKEIKALDADYNEENRSRCAEATGPLLEAVRGLCRFADSPEFAAIPAKISPQARRNQEDILECGRSIISASCSMIESAKVLSVTPQERSQWQALANHSKTVSDSIKSLVTNIREKAPGQRECALALETVGRVSRELDQAAISAVTQDLQPRKTHTLQGYCEQIENSASEILERLEPLRAAAKSEAENLGHTVTQMTSYLSPLTSWCIGLSSVMSESVQQAAVLDRTRTVLETAAQLIQAAKDSAGNSRATSAHMEVDEQVSLCRAAVSELVSSARDLSTQHGAVRPLLDAMSRSIARLTEHRMSLIGSYDEADSFVDYQTRMVSAAKEVARLATDMKAKAATDASRLVELGNEMCQKYEQLAQDSVGASATTPNADVANRVRNTVVSLGESVSELIKAGGECRMSATPANQQMVSSHSKNVNEKVISVLSALQAGSRGTQACIDAASTIGAIIGDLDTTILFASAGTLHSEREGDTFAEHRESILKTAKTLVEDTKSLVGGAAATQEQLAEAANSAVSTIVQLCEVVKQGAMSLGSSNPESQVLLLHAARDVAAALRDLCIATKGASGKHVSHPDMERLKHSAKKMNDATKRWSLPVKTQTIPRRNSIKRRSLMNKYESSCDSETDVYVSDQEDELLKLLDYSSQDDDVSPTIFHDNCEEIIAYIESLMKHTVKRLPDYDLNEKYNLAARNSVVSMDWRVVKYGENIMLGEVKKLVDIFVEYTDLAENKRKIDKIKRLKANNELDTEMKRLSQVLEDIDESLENEAPKIQELKVIPAKKPKLEERILRQRLKNPLFKIKKVKPINLMLNLDLKSKDFDIIPVSPKSKEIGVVNSSKEAINGNKVTSPELNAEKQEFWKMFKDDSEWWRALAKRHLEKMDETRKELDRFSGHELVLGEIQNELEKYEKEKQTLQLFIDEIDTSKELQYNKKYEDMVLKLIDFAKREDFVYKGFDPIIEKLNELSQIEIERRKRKLTEVKDITQIDITKYTYEELCILENYYKQVLNEHTKSDKENQPIRENNDISTNLVREEPPTYHKNIILTLNSKHNIERNVSKYTHQTLPDSGTSKRTKINNSKTENNSKIFDLTRTYPLEYYANNWWSIYEDILKNREQQFGSIDNWWNFYEAILNKDNPSDEELHKIRAVVEYRNRMRKSRPNSRVEEQLRMIDEVKNDRFTETEAVTTQDSEATMVTNVTSLLKTVKAVEDEHTRGSRAMESTIEAINQEIDVLLSPSSPKSTCSPEELVRFTSQMTSATAKAVSAGNSGKQDQLTAAANLGRKTVIELLQACKGAAFSAESAELKQRTLEAGAEAARAYRDLLTAVLGAANGDTASKNNLPHLSRRVAQAVADIIATAHLLKGSEWVDPDDPTVIAENELLGAAASIDAAARKLDSLRPRTQRVQETDETLNFDEMILEAAKSIIAATSALIRAASAAQRELIDQGKVDRRPTFSSDDGQWSEGLVSAARLVAAAAHSLVEAANALVQGAGSEERLISSARQVASCTAQLLVACKVKADPSSESTRRLQSAGAEVIRSTDNLVRAARNAIRDEEERSLVLNRRMVGGIAQEIDARSEVLRIEKELDEARNRLVAIKKAKYLLRNGETSGEDTDTDVTINSNRYRANPPQSSFANTTYSPNSSLNTTLPNSSNLSQHISALNQSIHGTPTSPGFNTSSQGHYGQGQPGYGQGQPGYGQGQPGYGQGQSGHGQGQPGYGQTQQQYSPGYAQSPSYGQQHSPGYVQGQNYAQGQNYGQNKSYESQQYNGSFGQSKPAQSPSFSSFRPKSQEDAPKQNYEGFTTRTEMETTEKTVIVKTLRLPEVKTAVLVTDDPNSAEKKIKPPPPPRKASLLNYETRSYDTSRPDNTTSKSEEKTYHSSSSHMSKQEQRYDSKTATFNPKFNARELKDSSQESMYSTLKKPLTLQNQSFDGLGHNFSEHQKSTEHIPGGTKQTEFSIKSESYQSYPQTDYKQEFRKEVKSPFATSTPTKSEFKQFSEQSYKAGDLVKVVTPEFERISSPYGKEKTSVSGPNYLEESSTEVKEIPNGTQKITTTKIYSSSPVQITSTNTKYEPLKLEGIDELQRIDSDSKYSTLDSRFSTLDSKASGDSARFMRPSDFQTEFQTSTVKVHSPTTSKDIESLDKKFSKQTIKSERIERKSVMTSTQKSETSSTVTKKFGNF